MFQYFDAYTVAQAELALGTKVYLAIIYVCLKALAGSAGPTSKLVYRERGTFEAPSSTSLRIRSP